jgi:hypothetical protein
MIMLQWASELCAAFLQLQVMEHLGAAAFSRAVQARDLRTGALVCLKVVKVISAGLHSSNLAATSFPLITGRPRN